MSGFYIGSEGLIARTDGSTGVVFKFKIVLNINYCIKNIIIVDQCIFKSAVIYLICFLLCNLVGNTKFSLILIDKQKAG